jgi:CRISPR-associated exonuclease Cas4
MATAIGLIVLALLLWLLSARLRKDSGLPEGDVIYSDTGAWQRNAQTLFSERHQLSGKPDYLVRDGDLVVPVEVKSAAAPARPRDGHVLQLAAYCLLVEAQLGATVRRGIIQYADRRFVIDYTPALEARLLSTLNAMRADLDAGRAARSHKQPGRCRSCGVRQACDENLFVDS